MGALNDSDYRRLLQFRTNLRRFLHWSEERAREAGVTPAHHQLMLAVRGHPDPQGPSIGELADYLMLRHNSAVGLVDRAEAAGLVERVPDGGHPGTVRVRLTASGSERLEALSAAHLDELARLAPAMSSLWDALRSVGLVG
ncbi:MAG TPA: MarR family winged helix-turn-helix transcriptional regulator [Solirubrobacteraceae bacterium]|nr:MarR family winged helix-turn-helix transcriptional regulator [Solirubrobacteraceae bacterium]